MNELEQILTDLCKCSRINLYSDVQPLVLSDMQFRRLAKILKDRARQVPIAYSLGFTEFMGLRLKVNRDVLIPRPETELLVEAVVEKVRSQKSEVRSQKILDMGTGSGCIAIALAKFLKDFEIVAVDVSKKTLCVAYDNARLHAVEKHIQFLESDLFNHNLFKTDCKFDIIVSNPPYVPTLEIGLFDAALEQEPKISLDGGRDGCDFYRRISKEACRYLKNDGFLFLEIGDEQVASIRNIFSDKWVVDELRKDYQGIERVCIIKKNKEDFL